MNCLQLEIRRPSGNSAFAFEVKRVVNAGYVGRDEAAVRRHIAELLHQGVAEPPSVPMLFPVLASNVTTTEEIETIELRTSGEVEFVLLLHGGTIRVGIGSDHTDRRLEAVDMIKSKQACPNVLGRTVWDFDEVRNHWDELILQSWVRVDAAQGWSAYQDAPVASILSASQLMELVRSRVSDGRMDGMVIFSGTVPTLDGKVVYGSGFRCALVDPVLNRSLECSYSIKHLDYIGPARSPAGS
jgi:hypothetical protein